MMKKLAVSTLFKALFGRVHRMLFRHMVNSGLILCAVAPLNDEDDANTGNADDQQDVQTGDDTGTAAENGLDDGSAGNADDEEVVVTFGDEDPPASNEEDLDAPGLVNKLRKLNRDKDRELRELRSKVQAPAAPAPAVAQVAKPTLADCEYDEEAYETKLTAWHEQQAKLKAEQQAKEAQEREAADAWKAKLDAHGKAKAALKVPDFEEAEATAAEVLSISQQGIIVNGADNSALVVYALGKNPVKLKELASIKDPVKFAFAIARLETTLKVTPRKAPPPPERQVRGNAPVSGGGDQTLERLRAEAAKSGDMSKVIAYKRQKRAA